VKFKNIFLILAMGVFTQSALCSCKFSMQGMKYFFNNSEYKIGIESETVCSNSSYSKRRLENISLVLKSKYSKDVLTKFESGYWSPDKSKFILKNSTKITSGCFAGVQSISLNLASGVITSIKGPYLNLKTGNSYKYTCKI
jgi:hypothetical protein